MEMCPKAQGHANSSPTAPPSVPPASVPARRLHTVGQLMWTRLGWIGVVWTPAQREHWCAGGMNSDTHLKSGNAVAHALQYHAIGR